MRRALVLAAVLFGLLAAGAQAHTERATITCGSVTFAWSSFAASGGGNGGLNQPAWQVTTAGRSTPISSGTASFPGASYSLKVAIPAVNGNVTASSSWAAQNTRDGNSGSGSDTAKVVDCTALSSTASPATTVGGSIHDTAHLSGGAAPTGRITFHLYAASDTACRTSLATSSTPVSGNGDYDSPAVTATTEGSYQWTATYSGDANNAGVGPKGCGDPSERVSVTTPPPTPPSTTTTTPAPPAAQASTESAATPASPAGPVVVVAGACVSSPAALRLSKKRTAGGVVRLSVPATGLTSVTFTLDGHKLKTVTKSRHGAFAVTVHTRRLSYGRHTVGVKAKHDNANCTASAARATFVRVRVAVARPKFTG
jgi:hypothetical protein